MELSHVTFAGPPFEEDAALIAALPDNLVALLRQINGFIVLEGALHVRGVCRSPEWHGLAPVMAGPKALHALYPAVLPTDVPFAQDCVADQYLLRQRKVFKLEAETGTLVALNLSLPEFFAAVHADPLGFLAMQPLLQFQQVGGFLQPGQVLQVYPPFCTQEASKGVALSPVPASAALAFLADFARQTSTLSEGQAFSVKVGP